MSILTGGLFSNPSGKMGGVVFGAARTRTGKKVTSRLLVPPSNPDTVAQQTQRSKFAEALAIVRLAGTAVYQSDWNRAIGQLPGFQSLTSVMLNSIDASNELNTIPPINLGSLHTGGITSAAPGIGAKQIDITYPTANGINGTAADVVVILLVQNAPAASPLEREVKVDTTGVRSDGVVGTSMVLGSELWSILLWYQGAGTADGLLSATTYIEGSNNA